MKKRMKKITTVSKKKKINFNILLVVVVLLAIAFVCFSFYLASKQSSNNDMGLATLISLFPKTSVVQLTGNYLLDFCNRQTDCPTDTYCIDNKCQKQ